jgi:ketosteroid isomerase-like protein
MSHEDVSLVRQLYELLPNLRESEPEAVDRVDRFFAGYVDDQFEVQLPSDYPEGEQVFRGREGIQAVIAAGQETWSEWGFVPDRFLDAHDRVVVFARIVAVGRESGVPIELETTHVWTIREGRASAMRVYRNRSEALEAVGLRE